MVKKRKSKKWGPGNPLWEWKQKNKRSSKRTKKRVGSMVKRRKAYRRSKGGNLLSGKGMLGAKIGMGMLGTIGAGLIGAEVAKRVMPNNQIATAGIGFLLGGPIGAATAYFMPNGISSLTGMLGGSSAATGSGIPIYG